MAADGADAANSPDVPARPAKGDSTGDFLLSFLSRLGRRVADLGQLGLSSHLSPEDRRNAMDALMLRPSAATLRRFSVLMCLSVVVASLGLLQNSTAVVVGAMMIAPLMAPIMGIAASLVIGWGERLLNGVIVVSVSVLGAVAVSWAIAKVLPLAGTGLPAELLARSSPDVRDLVVALAAGAAGAFATVRKDVSGALPGVAVAVALVPPLASVGALLGRDQPDLAQGAMLLFATNLFGIILAAAVVFVLTGFVPMQRLRASRNRTLMTVAVITVPTLAVGAVLTDRFIDTADHSRELRLATGVVLDWLGPGDELNRITLNGTTVQVNVTGAVPPPRLQGLTESLRDVLGHPTTVDLRWTPVGSAEPEEPVAPTIALDAVRPVAEQWLAEQSLTLDGLSYESATLVVRCSGAEPPKSGDELSALVKERFGSEPPVNLAWTQASAQDADASGPDTFALTARAAAEKWAQAHPGTAVLAVDQRDATVTVTIIGTVQPDVADLQLELAAALPQASVTVQWVSGSILGQTVPAAPAPPTPGPTSSISPVPTAT